MYDLSSLALLIREKMHSKSELRKVVMAERQSIPGAQRSRYEDSILVQIRSLPSFDKADSIALYMPVRGEMSLLSLWQPGQKRVLFPRVAGNDLVFSPAASPEDFIQGMYGIPEPITEATVNVNRIDVVFVPGLVFDRHGHRLGYGKGYYDRLIRNHPDVLFIGVCPDEFCIDELPVDPWDARVDLVVTQTRVFKYEGEVE